MPLLELKSCKNKAVISGIFSLILYGLNWTKPQIPKVKYLFVSHSSRCEMEEGKSYNELNGTCNISPLNMKRQMG